MYKVGVIGCGAFSEHHHEGLTKTGRARITDVWSRTPEHRDAAAAKWGAAAHDSAQALIESSVDVVVICTPGFAHRQYVEPAAAAGKHILCEKPLALTLEDAYAIRDAVHANPVTFMVGFSLRHDPRMLAMRRLQQSDGIGQTVSAWYRIYAPSPSSRWLDIEKSGHWRASNELSGGRINEFGSHGVNWLLWTLGRPLSVYGKSMIVTRGFTVDDADYGIVTCQDGVGVIEINRHAAVEKSFNCGIIGHRGSVVLDDTVVRHTPMDGQTVDVPIDDSVTGKHDHFLNCIESGATPINDVDDAIDTLRVCLAFNQSAQSGQAVDIQSLEM